MSYQYAHKWYNNQKSGCTHCKDVERKKRGEAGRGNLAKHRGMVGMILEGSKAGSQEACGELISFVYGGMDVPEDSLEGAGNRVEALPRLKECHGVAGPWSARCYPVQTS